MTKKTDNKTRICGLLLAFSAPLLACLAFACASARADAPCPNEAIREAQTSSEFPTGTVGLPDCMALEMVSPSAKNQQAAFVPMFSLDGARVRFKSPAALAETPGQQFAFGDRYVAERGALGWSVAPTSPPGGSKISKGGENAGGPYAFAPDLGSWILFGATQAQTQAATGQIFRGGLDGSFTPFSPLLEPIDNSGNDNVQFTVPNFASDGTSTDLTTTVFRYPLPTTYLFPGDPHDPTITSHENQPEPGDDANIYVGSLDQAGEPTVELLTRDKDDVVYGGRCGSRLGGGANDAGVHPGSLNQGAISATGSRIYFSTRPAQPWDQATHEGPRCDPSTYPLRVFDRTETPEGPEITELVPGPGGPTEAGDDMYQAASLDGGKVYLTSPRNLTGSDQDASAEECDRQVGASRGCDLYLYDADRPAGERLTQVSAGGAGDPEPGKGADVLSSITAVSGDGSHVYFTAQGVLTTDPNPEGDVAQPGEPNLYLYERDAAHPAGRTDFLGVLSEEDKGKLWGVEQSFVGGAYAVPLLGEDEGGLQVGGDGHILLFVSKASLSADDTDGGHADVYRYDADGQTLQRISKAAPGGSEFPPADASANANLAAPNTTFATEGRWVSEDGDAVVFASAEPLTGVTSSQATSYLWENGRLARLPGQVASPERNPTISPDGSEVAFTTKVALLPQDGDTSDDVYLARAEGGFANPVSPDVCLDETCQGPLGAAPPAPRAASLSFTGPGNVKKSGHSSKPRCPKATRRIKRGGKVHCVRKRSQRNRNSENHVRAGRGQGGSK